jgi:hypothetical protein
MSEYSIPIDYQDTTMGESPPVPWSDTDEKNWKLGFVHCPKRMSPAKPAMEWCLKANELKAINAGAIPIWDEQKV